MSEMKSHYAESMEAAGEMSRDEAERRFDCLHAAEVRKAKAEALRDVVTYLCGNREIGRWILMHADRIEAGDD